MRRFVVLTTLAVLTFGVFLAWTKLREVSAPREVNEIAKNSSTKAGILDLYNKIEHGMSREQVESILGAPIHSPLERGNGEVHVDYLSQEYAERGLQPHESPIMIGGISVTYVDNRLIDKSYNSQWLKQLPPTKFQPQQSLQFGK